MAITIKVPKRKHDFEARMMLQGLPTECFIRTYEDPTILRSSPPTLNPKPHNPNIIPLKSPRATSHKPASVVSLGIFSILL